MNPGFVEICIGHKAVIYGGGHIYRLFRDLVLNGSEELMEDALFSCLLKLNCVLNRLVMPLNSDCE
jgi:hypothetical protein